MRWSAPIVVAAATAFSPTATALAADGTSTVPLAPVAKPQAGKATIAVSGGRSTRKLRYVPAGSAMRITATIRPFVAGQTVVLELSRGGKVVSRRSATLRQGRRGSGTADFRFTASKSGTFAARVVHAASPQLAAFASRRSRFKVARLAAGSGSRGPKVVLLQRSLRAMGFATPVNGRFDAATARGVLAFRKTNGLGRSGFAKPRVFVLAFAGRGAFRARFPRAGKHVEFDWSRQVLALMNGSRPVRVLHASSGKPSTPTVFGSFRFYRKQPGTNDKGMVDSNYFIRGYAIHGYPEVPNYPASHGCIRIPIPNAAEVDRLISIGERIFVYR